MCCSKLLYFFFFFLKILCGQFTSFYLFIYLFLAVLGLRFCTRALSSCGKWGPLFIAVRGPLIIAASLVAEHRLQTRRLSNCGSRAQLLRGMWDLPRPGLEPVSPALAGRLSTTAPPGKPQNFYTFADFFFFFCLPDLPFTERCVLKPPNIIVDLSTSPYSPINFYYIYFGALSVYKCIDLFSCCT